MKPTLVAMAVLLASVLSPSAQTNPPATNTIAPATTNFPAGNKTTNATPFASGLNSQTSLTELDAFLKYQEFLRKESDQSAAQLNGLIQHTKDWLSMLGFCIGILMTLVAGVLVFIGFTSATTVKKFIQAMADDQLQKAVQDFREKTQAAFDARLKLIDSAYSRRQAKYLKLLRSFFEKLFATNPDLVKKLLGSSLNNQSLRGKRALWVEDDGVGIALLVELLKTHCGLEIEIAESTERALSETLTKYELVISNLRRDPHDDAGIKLTEAIRNEHRSQIPIIIFTRPENVTLYKDAIQKAGATAIATSHDELLSEVAKCFQPKSATPKKP
jgi:CheY-like chemotaxis protein